MWSIYCLILFYFCIVFVDSRVRDHCPSSDKLLLENGRVMVFNRKRPILQFICKRGYTRMGNFYGTCRKGEIDVPIPICVKPGCEKLPDLQNGVGYTEQNGGYVRFFCKPNYEIKGSPGIYCNGENWNDTIPTCVGDTSGTPIKCDFDMDMCEWADVTNEDGTVDSKHGVYQSKLLFGVTMFPDHTRGDGTGSFLILSNDKTSKTTIISPIYSYKLSNNSCFSFYIHPVGLEDIEIQVYVKPETLGLNYLTTSHQVYVNNKHLRRDWNRLAFEIPKMDEDFQILIMSTKEGFIGIDDIEIIQSDECYDILEEQKRKDKIYAPFNNITAYSCANRCYNTQLEFTYDGEYLTCTCTDQSELDNCADFFEICVENVKTTTDEDSDETTTPMIDVPKMEIDMKTTTKTIATKVISTTTVNVTKSTTQSTTKTTAKPPQTQISTTTPGKTTTKVVTTVTFRPITTLVNNTTSSKTIYIQQTINYTDSIDSGNSIDNPNSWKIPLIALGVIVIILGLLLILSISKVRNIYTQTIANYRSDPSEVRYLRQEEEVDFDES